MISFACISLPRHHIPNYVWSETTSFLVVTNCFALHLATPLFQTTTVHPGYSHTSPSWQPSTNCCHHTDTPTPFTYWTAWSWRWRHYIPSKGWEPLTLTQHHITADPNPLRHCCEKLKAHKAYLVSWISGSPQYAHMTYCHTHLLMTMLLCRIQMFQHVSLCHWDSGSRYFEGRYPNLLTLKMSKPLDFEDIQTSWPWRCPNLLTLKMSEPLGPEDVQTSWPWRCPNLLTLQMMAL